MIFILSRNQEIKKSRNQVKKRKRNILSEYMKSQLQSVLKLDIQKKKYSMKILQENIYALNLWDILKYQTIDTAFAVHFLLNFDFQLTSEEEKITIHDVLHYQPHIVMGDLLNIYVLGEKKLDVIFDTQDDFIVNPIYAKK